MWYARSSIFWREAASGLLRLSSFAFAFIFILASRFPFLELITKNRRVANATFLGLPILLVIPKLRFMELRHLRYFAAVAAHGSFSRAANQLHLTQPALSRQVKSLEDEIGITLIVRGKNTISLT